jgi:hypothetical protein
MAKAKKDNLKELKALGEELYEILAPEDEDTGEEMELDDFLLNGKKKLTAKVLEANLVEFCEALEEEDGDEASGELVAFMNDHDIEIPWDASEPEVDEVDEEDELDEDEEDPDEEEDDDSEEEDGDDDEDEEDDDETPDFNKMKIAELKAYCKENGIKGIAGKKKPELIVLIEESLGDVEEPDDDEEDEEETESKYDELSLKEIKALMKKAGHTAKAIKKMDRDEMIEHLEAADDAEEEDDVEEEEKELSLEEILNETTKLADLQALVAEHDEFKKLRKKAKKIKGLHGPRELKPLMYKAIGIEAPAKQKRTPKSTKKKGPSYNRIDSVKDAIKKLGKKGFTQEDVRELSDKLYCEKTENTPFDNEAKMHPATHIVNYMVQGLVAFDVLEKDGKKYKLV